MDDSNDYGEDQTKATIDSDEPDTGSNETSNDSDTNKPDTDTAPETIQRPVSVKSKSKSRKKLITIAVVILVLLGGSASAWYFVSSKNGQQDKTNKTLNSKTDKKPGTSTESDPQLAKFIKPTTGETWLDKPVAIAKQGFFIMQDPLYDYGEKATDYFKVGTRGDNTIILTASPGVNMDYHLFEQYPDGKVALINQPDGLAVYNKDNDAYLQTTLDPKVKIIDDIHYDSLSIPDQISIDSKGSVVMAPSYPNLGIGYMEKNATGSDGTVYTVIKQLGGSTLYRSESTNAETHLVSIGYFMRTPFGNRIDLRYEPLDLSLRDYQWTTGYTSSTDSLRAISHGCSALTASVTRSDSITDGDVEEVGKSGKGLVVYGFKDTNNALFQKAYIEFKDYMQYDTTNANKNITATDFDKQHAVVLYKDVNGQWLVYVRGEFSPAYGCAKPVVYLYPEATQQISVRVGASVKMSDPYYDPKTGWSVIAKPNGQLTVNGQSYNSLFWEGPGIGQYPQVTKGTIVKQQDLISTIRKQLAQQGLNNTEINDFVDYWHDNLPTKPYVRLTWFDTAQMNELAPLFITPKPTTLIRVFMDASGLDKPINIPAQHLKSTPRNGFTVVEWGGLPSHRLY